MVMIVMILSFLMAPNTGPDPEGSSNTYFNLPISLRFRILNTGPDLLKFGEKLFLINKNAQFDVSSAFGWSENHLAKYLDNSVILGLKDPLAGNVYLCLLCAGCSVLF